LMLLLLLTTCDCFLRDHPSQYQAVRPAGGTSQRYLHPDIHKITAAGAALSAHFSALRAPRSLPSPIVMTR
ncbi:hypothetical protein ACWEQM_15170, partial [Streptomyces nodosus]